MLIGAGDSTAGVEAASVAAAAVATMEMMLLSAKSTMMS